MLATGWRLADGAGRTSRPVLLVKRYDTVTQVRKVQAPDCYILEGGAKLWVHCTGPTRVNI